MLVHRELLKDRDWQMCYLYYISGFSALGLDHVLLITIYAGWLLVLLKKNHRLPY
jgi:hypothetical protein